MQVYVNRGTSYWGIIYRSHTPLYTAPASRVPSLHLTQLKLPNLQQPLSWRHTALPGHVNSILPTPLRFTHPPLTM